MGRQSSPTKLLWLSLILVRCFNCYQHNWWIATNKALQIVRSIFMTWKEDSKSSMQCWMLNSHEIRFFLWRIWNWKQNWTCLKKETKMTNHHNNVAWLSGWKQGQARLWFSQNTTMKTLRARLNAKSLKLMMDTSIMWNINPKKYNQRKMFATLFKQ